MKTDVTIKEDLPLEVAYTLENPPAPKPQEPRRCKFEREQKRLDASKREWFKAMVWGMWTTGR
jgi:hypothetical protein